MPGKHLPNEYLASLQYSARPTMASNQSLLKELEALKDAIIKQADVELGSKNHGFKYRGLMNYKNAVEKTYKSFLKLKENPTDDNAIIEFNEAINTLHHRKYLASVSSKLLDSTYVFTFILAGLALLTAIGAAIAVTVLSFGSAAFLLAGAIGLYASYTALGLAGISGLLVAQKALRLPSLTGALSLFTDKNAKQTAELEYSLKQAAIECSPGYKKNHTSFFSRKYNEFKLDMISPETESAPAPSAA